MDNSSVNLIQNLTLACSIIRAKGCYLKVWPKAEPRLRLRGLPNVIELSDMIWADLD
jgi:hypothetical protein